jgi:plastocyanin
MPPVTAVRNLILQVLLEGNNMNTNSVQPTATETPKAPQEKKKSWIMIVVILVLLLLVASLVAKHSSSDKDNKATPATSQTFTVEINSDGFDPQTLSVPSGSTVQWVNKTNDPYRIAANPQPSHNSFPALDSKNPIGPDATYSFTFTKDGTFVYNNQYNPTTNNGVIKVGNAK